MCMDLSIIFVNYKTAQLLLNCIDSIYAQTKTLSIEIIIADNFSQDDSQEIVTHKFPNIAWIDMGYNAGFARANNAGIKIATGEYLLILNTDTIILDGALDKAVALFKTENTAIACGVQLLNTDGSNQISGAHFIKGGLNFLLPLPYFGKFVRYWGYRLNSTVPSITSVSDKVEVDWIVGAFILITKKIAQANLLDEDFFMYAEEIEWCSRLRQQGKLFLYEAPKVIHLGGATSGSFYNTKENDNSKNLWNKKGLQILISMMLRIRKQFGVSWFLIMLVFFVVEIPIFVIGLFIENIFAKQPSKYNWLDFKNYTINIFILVKYTVKIIINKPHFYKVT